MSGNNLFSISNFCPLIFVSSSLLQRYVLAPVWCLLHVKISWDQMAKLQRSSLCACLHIEATVKEMGVWLFRGMLLALDTLQFETVFELAFTGQWSILLSPLVPYVKTAELVNSTYQTKVVPNLYAVHGLTSSKLWTGDGWAISFSIYKISAVEFR